MLQSIAVIHRKSREPFIQAQLDRHECLLWQTCLRQIVIGPASAELAALARLDDEYLVGENAYKFCLEVICGLHSPMVGETEVLGQFRQFFKDFPFARLSWGATLRRLLQGWLADAKQVREQFLIGHGSQSYGSVVRRELKGMRHIVMMGSGLFVEELLPWILKEQVQVEVVARNPDRLRELEQSFPALRTTLLANYRPQMQACQALVIAAPLKSSEVYTHLAEEQGCFALTLDLRGESGQDPLAMQAPVVALHRVFAQMRETEHLLKEKSIQARYRIQEILKERSRRIENRPFGWDDLCA
jgi:glutamyl-tRNA reductase